MRDANGRTRLGASVGGWVSLLAVAVCLACSSSAAAPPSKVYIHYSGTVTVVHPFGVIGEKSGPRTWGSHTITITWNGTATADLGAVAQSRLHLHLSQLTGSIHIDEDGAPAGSPTKPPCTASVSEKAGSEQRTEAFGWDLAGMDAKDGYLVTSLLTLPAYLSSVIKSSAPDGERCGIDPTDGIGPNWTAPYDFSCPRASASQLAAYDKAIAPTVKLPSGGATSRSFDFSFSEPCYGRTLSVKLTSVLAASFSDKETPPAKGNPTPTPGKKKPKSGGIDIVDVRTGKTVTGKTVETVAGQLTNLRVKTKDGTQPADPRWTVPGTGAARTAVKDYVITATSGTVVPLQLEDENDDTVRFHLVNAGRHTVEVSASGDTASVQIDVAAPTVDPANPAEMCKTGIASTSHNPRLPGTILGVGYTDNCPTSPGIQWHFTVHAPEGGAGNIAVVQLLTKEVKHSSTTVAGTVEKLHVCPKLSRPTPWADDASFYDQRSGKPPRIWQPEIPSSGTVTWTDSDSPHLPLRTAPVLASDTWFEKFAANDYVMFKSSSEGSIWVPLATLQWGWSGLANFLLPPAGKNRWTLQGSSTAEPVLDASPPALPEWPDAFTSSGKPDCS